MIFIDQWGEEEQLSSNDFHDLQGSGGIREHVDIFLLRNKGTVEYCAMKIKGGGGEI